MEKNIIEMAKGGIEILKKMAALKNALEIIKTLLARNELLDFVRNHRMLPCYLGAEGAKRTRELLRGLGNHAYDLYSDDELNAESRRKSGLDNYQEKERKFNELMKGEMGSQMVNALGLAGFGDDPLIDPIHDIDELSCILETFDSIFRCLEYEMRWPGYTP